MSTDAKAFQTLKQDEGLRLKAYQDHKGIWTIGYGTNLQVLKIDEHLAERWLAEKWLECKRLAADIPGYEFLNDARQSVIHSMIYQMGFNGTLKFQKMWVAIRMLDFKMAATEMRDSQWWKDPATQGRAERMAKRMEQGIWDV